jgi:Pectate lyase superfamily protein
MIHLSRLLATALLLTTSAGAAALPPLPEEAPVIFPADPAVVNVMAAPYLAKGDGVTDDTAALQRAINENTGRHKLIFFPKGTYLISRTLTWPNQWEGRNNWGQTMLRGEHRNLVTLKLKDHTFKDPAKPAAMMWCGGFGSADWFHNYVEHLTFDVGDGNPGATALQFYSNNSGAVRHCRFTAPPGSGMTGLDLGHRDMNGPLLVRNCEVNGFRCGIATGHSVNGQTLEHITLRGQTEYGLDNSGQNISLRGLTSENAVPAVRSYGILTLLDASCTGRPGAAQVPAIINYNGGRIFLRDIATTGYNRALVDVATPDFMSALRTIGKETPGLAGPSIPEYLSQAPTSPFPSPAHSLRLPVKETPEVPQDDPQTWANVNHFGADPTGKEDSAAAVQKVIDSGATTIFLPGFYTIKSPVILRGAVRRLIGIASQINYGLNKTPAFLLADGAASVVILEHFTYIGGGVKVDTSRTLVMRSVSDCDLQFSARAVDGELFFEDCVTHDLRLRQQRVWARQLDIENEGTHLTNDDSDLWILGYKTERGGSLLHARGKARSEILGGFSYTTTAGKLAPMFVNEASSVFAWLNEVCYSGDPFLTLIRETREGIVKEVPRATGHTLPYSGHSLPTPP